MFLLSFLAILLQSGHILGACPNCKPDLCSSADKCTGCNSGYRFNKNYKCEPCEHNCGECQFTTTVPCKSCRPGYHGTDCMSSCPPGCFICRRSDGICEHNCTTGGDGHHCGGDKLPIDVDSTNQGSPSLSIIAVSMVVGVLVVVVVTGYVLFRRRAFKRCVATQSTDKQCNDRRPTKAEAADYVSNSTDDVNTAHSSIGGHDDGTALNIGNMLASDNTYAVIEETDYTVISSSTDKGTVGLPVGTTQVYDVLSGSGKLITNNADTYSHISHSVMDCQRGDNYDHVTRYEGHVTVQSDTTYGLPSGTSGEAGHIYGYQVDRLPATSEYTYMDCGAQL